MTTTTMTKEMIRKELANKGIEMSNTKFKATKREELLAMLEKANEVVDNTETVTPINVPVGDMTSDNYYPEKVVIDVKHGDYLVKNIVKASFIATKGDSKGKRIVTMHKLFGIIRKAYANGDEKLDEAFIKNIINQLVSLKYICFKKYESGAMVFYPTTKANEYAKTHK